MSTYGFCPKCGLPGAYRERRPNGNDRCEDGHVYPSRDAVIPPFPDDAELPIPEFLRGRRKPKPPEPEPA